MSIEDEREGPPPTEAEIAAWKADQAACRAETFARCKLQGACAEPHGSRWQLLVQDDERAGKCPELKKPSSTRRSARKTSPRPWPTRSACRP